MPSPGNAPKIGKGYRGNGEVGNVGGRGGKAMKCVLGVYGKNSGRGRRTIDQAVGGKLRDKNDEESWALLEDLAFYDNESWNDPRDLAKPVKAISMPQDVPSTSDRRLIDLENQVQRLMEAYLAPNQTIQVNRITSSREICCGPHDTQYCMENPEQAFVEFASTPTDKAGGLMSNFMASQDAKISRFEVNFKQYQSEVSNKLDTFLKALITGVLPSNTIETPTPKEPEKTLEDEFANLHLNLPVLEVLAHVPMYDALLDKYIVSLELGKNGSEYIQSVAPEKMKDPRLFILPCKLGDSKLFDTLADLGSCVNLLPLKLFKKLKVGLLEETDDVLGLADGTKSYPVGIVKNVEVHVGKLKLF
ncbi:MAK10-like protein [Tanacetum coccineum]